MNKMNSKIHLKKLFAVTVLGAGLTLGFAQTGNAADRDVKEARKEVKQERRDVKEAKKDVKEERRDLKEARKDVKQEKREDRRDGNWNNGHSNNGNWNNRPNTNYHKPNYNKPTFNYGRNNSNSNYRTFTGTVTKVSNNRFDIRVGNITYNVAASSRPPRSLDRGDVVRVYGERFGQNDIRNASVSIINNR
jgi:hypothetical protein